MGEQHVYDQFIINYEAMNNCRFACCASHPSFESHCSQQRHLSKNNLLVSQSS